MVWVGRDLKDHIVPTPSCMLKRYKVKKTRLKLWLRSDKLEALGSDTQAAQRPVAVPAVGQSLHLRVR